MIPNDNTQLGPETVQLVRELVTKTDRLLSKFGLAMKDLAENQTASYKVAQKHAEKIIELRDGLEKLESLNARHADSIASHAKSLANYGEAISKLLAYCFPEEAELAKKEQVH